MAARDSDQRRELELEASILDTPGVFFEALAEPGPGDIDESSVEALVCATRNARCLVVCVDASVEPGDGTPDLVTPVSRLLGVGSRRLPRMGAKPWPARESPWERAPRLELPFERVLLLLTKIDVLCTEVARWWTGIEGQWLSASASDIQSVAALPALGAWDIAGALDPWLLARDRIDGLDILASCLKPDAQLAVCAISADGLDTVGPHDREILTFEEQPEEGPIVSMAERASLHGDLPFGIWPALRFLIQGQVVPPLETRGPAREPQVPRPSARVELLEAESP